MGVPCDLVLYAPSEEVANAAAQAAYERIAQLNRLFSDYEPDSELMRLSRTAGSGRKFPLSQDLLEILQESQHWSSTSNGAFDVTVGPLVKLWRKSRRLKRLPPPDELAAAQAAVGHQFLKLDPAEKTATLTHPKMQLDLGGIAKGYASQAAVDLLKQRGISSALCAMAGDIVVSSPPPGKPGWRIGIAPLDPSAEPDRHILLKDAAVSTSGDSQQFVIIDGIRYSHIVDPKTGLGLTTSSSVTVIAPRGSTADALGTALSILPPPQALALIDQTPNTATLILRRENNTPQEHQSKSFSSFLEPK